MKYPKIPIVLLAAAMSAPTLAVADEDELELEEAFLFFELNDTDGDFGIHGKADGDAWKRMKIEAPNERIILDIRVKSRLRKQGLTELFFESAEPTFDELDPTTFFNRFPEGVYEWEGLTLDYEEIEGEVPLSHIIPAAPVVASVGEDGIFIENEDNPGFEQEEDDEGELVFDENENPVAEKACWGVLPDSNGDVVVTWNAVTMSHYDMWNFALGAQPLLIGEDLRYGRSLQPERKIPLGDPGTFMVGDLVYYEFVAEIDETEFKMTAVVPPGTTSWTVPAEIITLAEVEGEGEVKFEIIVRSYSGVGVDDDGEPVASTFGNQSAVEDCFEIAEDIADDEE